MVSTIGVVAVLFVNHVEGKTTLGGWVPVSGEAGKRASGDAGSSVLTRTARINGKPLQAEAAVIVVLAFGGGLSGLTGQLHFHVVVGDGVFDDDGTFHPLHELTDDDVASVLEQIVRRVAVLLEDELTAEASDLATTSLPCCRSGLFPSKSPASVKPRARSGSA
ncbi:MAG: hypothetical protein ACO3JL_03740, partial [Myxococcota bacterium]